MLSFNKNRILQIDAKRKRRQKGGNLDCASVFTFHSLKNVGKDEKN